MNDCTPSKSSRPLTGMERNDFCYKSVTGSALLVIGRARERQLNVLDGPTKQRHRFIKSGRQYPVGEAY